MKRGLSFLLAMIVVFCTLSSVTATVYADYDANLIAHQKIDNILQNYVAPDYHLDNYTFTESEEAELKVVAKEAIAGCTTDYEKISAITRFVAENIYYDYDYYEGRTDLVYTKPYDVWTNKRTVCDGYTRLTKALLNFINIPCMYVLGDYHAYNVAYDSENNRWIYLDSTWCSGNTYRNGEYKSGSYRESRFDMSLEKLSGLSYHEFINLKGIFVDKIEYRLITPDSKDSWANFDEWFLEITGVKDDYNVGDLDCSSISLYDIPLASVATSAFKNCSSLTSITIPNSVTSIGSNAFENCSSLKSITLPDSVTSIGWEAFACCDSLASVTIPDSVTSIGYAAFYDCENLTSVYITDIVAWCNIDFGGTSSSNPLCYADNLYLNRKLVADLVIPNSVTSIGSYAFYNCTSLKSIVLPDSVTSIGDSAFNNCTSITSITIPDSVESISYSAFRNCNSLESVIIHDNVKSIGDWAFAYCENLISVNLPDTLDSIGYASFYGTNIKNIFYSGNSTQWDKIEIGEYNYRINDAKIHYNATGHTSSSWIVDKKATAEGEGKKHKECTVCGEVLKTATIPQFKCSKPVLKAVSNVNSYVKITWGKVKGADLYRVYRKTGTGSYEYIGSTSNTYFNDKEAGAGKTCRYYVKAKNGAGNSPASASLAIKHIDEPTLKSIENTEHGVLIKWGKVTGAEKYNIYRKVSGGEYKYIGASSKTYYTDKTAESGTKYYYAIRAKRDDSISSQSSLLSKYYLAAPTLKTPTSTTSGIKLSWSKVTGAEGYMVYRKTGSGSYSKLKTEKGVSNLSYTDSSAKKGKKYTYKVKAYKSSTYSAYSNTKSITDKY